MIKDARKSLKEKVRRIVDKVGPQIFKNFDKMRLIMRDPSTQSYRKNPIHSNLPKTPVDMEDRVGNSELGVMMGRGSRNESRNISRAGSETVSATNYDLDYLEEIELNKALNAFSEI